MLRVSSHQTSFLPWAGFWNKVLSSDVVILTGGTVFALGDNAYHRTTLYGTWATVRVDKSTMRGPIKDVRVISASHIAERVEREVMGKKKPYSDRLCPIVRRLREAGGESLMDLNMDLLNMLFPVMGVTATLHITEALPVGATKTKRLLNRVRDYVEGPFTYLAGPGARDYLDREEFQAPVLFQSVAAGTAPDSILERVARLEFPGTYARSIASWDDK